MNMKRVFSYTFLIIGIIFLFCYHNNICGDYWQVGILASGVVAIAWSVKVME